MSEKPSYDDLATLLSEGLDLCARARKIDLAFDQQAARDVSPKSAEMYPDAFPLCMTPYVWVQEQYDRDLADWEARARKAMEPVVWASKAPLPAPPKEG